MIPRVQSRQVNLDEQPLLMQQAAESTPSWDGAIDRMDKHLTALQAQLLTACQASQELQELTAQQAGKLADLTARIEQLTSRENELTALLDTSGRERRQFSQRQDQLQSALYDLQTTVAIQNLSGTEASKLISYQQMIRRLRELVRNHVPLEATILVVSRGDDVLLDLWGRTGWHFPQTREGVWAGHHSPNSSAAIIHLEALRARGAKYLLFPSTSLWWLEHYKELAQHLHRRYQLVTHHDATGALYALRMPQESETLGETLRIDQVIAECQSRIGRAPSVLDWSSGLNLADRLPGHSVFSPPAEERSLPYIDQSIDVVAVGSDNSEVLPEARRVATAAVLCFSIPKGAVAHRPADQEAKQHDYTLTVDWCQAGSVPTLPEVSIIIPCHNNLAYTEMCLASLKETLPAGFRGEIIVVDDASTDETPERLRLLAQVDSRLRVLRNEDNVGFLGTSNRGAREARGEILVFLNNDTVLLPGWLPPLLRILRDYPGVGAVGGKLIFPEGCLQEAGGVVFADGSAAHFGRGDFELDALLYNYVREVDYCSACLLATPRMLFMEENGFDPRFEPAYYEDTDYCFQLRARGYRVYYQPESTLIHFEG